MCIVDASQILEGEYSIEVLPGGHPSGCKVDVLVVLQGQLSVEGFLSTVGMTTINEQSNVYYINPIPCVVLLSMGIGFQDSFTQYNNNSTYFVMWAWP